MEYKIDNFKKDFPDDNTCLEYIFKTKFGDNFVCPKCSKKGFYRIKKRRCYTCSWCGYQVYPTAKTIFHKSRTKLTKWFYAIYLMDISNNNISAKELQKHLGVTYKTAWRIKNKIKNL
jgi:predicted RNA-binding Zn-ribbon protein involved in translation (DUF1610 family)